jgi:hypothetical protein
VAVGVEAQHAGRIFVDATERIAHSIGPRTVLTTTASVHRAVAGVRAELRLRVANLLDTRYAVSGYLDFDGTGALVPHLVPAAGRSALLECVLAW